jgi:autotransporter-associated beta strand protein
MAIAYFVSDGERESAMYPSQYSVSLKVVLRLGLVIAALSAPFPTTSNAAKAGGGTTTTASLTYVNGQQKWVMRIDPEQVQSGTLSIQFDPARCSLDTTVGLGGVIYKNPFNQTTSTNFSQLGSGLILNISFSTMSTSPGDVDIYELVFNDLAPATPIDGVHFSVFANGNPNVGFGAPDSVTTFDPGTMTTTTYGPAQISSTTLIAKTGSNDMVWDPDTLYNNGHMGGAGTWDTTLSSFDNLPLPGLSNHNVAWDNTVNAHDIAVFGGANGGTVTVQGAISVGGFRFDMPGYDLEGTGTITISAPPSMGGPAMGSLPAIDTGSNNANIGVNLAGDGFVKLGAGTLTLTANNNSNFTQGVGVNGGTLLVNGSLKAPSLLVTQGTLGGNGTVNAAVQIGGGFGPAGGAIISPGVGIGTLTVASLSLLSDAAFKLEINSTTVMADKIIALGPVDLSNGMALLEASDLGSAALAVGTVFTIIDNTSMSATMGFFSGLPDGSKFNVGANTYQINYDVGSDMNDVTLTVVPFEVPEARTWIWAMSMLGAVFVHGIQRFRKRVVRQNVLSARG